MTGGLVEAALARYLFFHQQETALPVHQGGHRQAALQGWVISHKDSLSLVFIQDWPLPLPLPLPLLARAGRRAVPRPGLRGFPSAGLAGWDEARPRSAP
ncbi:hypothetical protein D3C78_1565940 [compost metagenome]